MRIELQEGGAGQSAGGDAGCDIDLGERPTVKMVMADWLENNGYVGLRCGIFCFCEIGTDLMEHCLAGHGNVEECQPYKMGEPENEPETYMSPEQLSG